MLGAVGCPATAYPPVGGNHTVPVDPLFVAGQFGLCQVQSGHGRRQLALEIRNGCLEICPTLDRRSGEGRIGKMLFVIDARAPMLGLYFLIEISNHSAEFLDHRFNLANLPTLVVNLKPLQPYCIITRLHTQLPHSLNACFITRLKKNINK
ncbi:MAG TPA: hypothetical protein VKN63_03590 [Afifellaceae bacterium]|nr:hypothetical protein [Afifellaceae bacterium]